MRPDINKILRADRRNLTRGAPMGDSDLVPEDGEPARCYLQRVRMVDGCYGADGTYWGMGTPLWCAFTVGDQPPVRVYMRAHKREDAKRLITQLYPTLTFHR